MSDVIESQLIRVTVSINYELRGALHHPEELVEKINERFQAPYIPSDDASVNPRWTVMETYRDLVVTGARESLE